MEIYSAGSNLNGQLCRSSNNQDPCKIYSPVESKIVSFSAGRNQNVAVYEDGTAYGSGSNRIGELGLKKQGDYSLPKSISLTKGFFSSNPFITKVACGLSFSLFLEKKGSVYITYNFSTQKVTSPEPIVSVHGFMQPWIIGASGRAYLIEYDENDASVPPKCQQFQILKDEIEESDKSLNIKSKQTNENIEPIIDICSISKWVIFLTKNGKIYSKRNNENEILLYENFGNQKICKISGKTCHILALNDQGEVYSLGLGNNGKLGLGNENDVDVFTKIESLNVKIIDISASTDFSCFIDDQNKVWFCGLSIFGSKKGKFLVPEKLTFIEGVVRIFCGYSHIFFFTDQNCVHPDSTIQASLFDTLAQSLRDITKTITGVHDLSDQQSDDLSHNLSININQLKSDENETIYSNNAEKYKKQIFSLEKEIEKLKKSNNSICEETAQLIQRFNETSQKLNNENSYLKDQNLELIEKLKQREYEIEELKLKNENTNLSRLNHENEKLKKQIEFLLQKKSQKFENMTFIDLTTFKQITDENLIGEGATAKVFCISKEKKYALKQLKGKGKEQESDFENQKHFFAESQFLFALRHPCIVTFYGFSYGDKTHPPSILLEYCPKNLSKVIKQLNVTEKMFAIIDILYAMRFIHSNNVVHRDLKPENILLNTQTNYFKLADFGLSRILPATAMSDSLTTGVGTLKFMAPEVMNELPYTNKADCYSFGVILYYIVTNGELPEVTIGQVCMGQIPEIPSAVNENCKQLILDCWEFDPEKRPSFNEIILYVKEKNYQLMNFIEFEKIKRRVEEIEMYEEIFLQ
ncbi:hypothetical protein TRFO_28038 [Tritrichomonas foetus]|uniref:Protein kinase domain-containing protein n=1 Tax=Tritrichomonas foetus TaxID=1144522 RepID=A0A1J4K3Z1_9EUKA|nr:hypothetical protein TRFO_28038 [Tritrichomonas foetus]|eukprot:OHT04476.1 hypothetical protein TRFO_28038 [Tritrichomonas foetus]